MESSCAPFRLLPEEEGAQLGGVVKPPLEEVGAGGRLQPHCNAGILEGWPSRAHWWGGRLLLLPGRLDPKLLPTCPPGSARLGQSAGVAVLLTHPYHDFMLSSHTQRREAPGSTAFLRPSQAGIPNAEPSKWLPVYSLGVGALVTEW